MSIDQIIDVLVTITVIQMMVTIGLGVTFAKVADVATNLRLAAQAALANYLLVPMAALALLQLFHSSPLVAASILMVAVCPGGPYGPAFTATAKGNLAISVGLMVILVGSSAILAPLILYVLLPISSGDQPTNDATKIVATLAPTQLLPLCIGVVIRDRRPKLAERLVKPANQLNAALNLAVFTVITVVEFHLLESIGGPGFAGMLAW
jgi:BASS family bile acid:Na+ symporter